MFRFLGLYFGTLVRLFRSHHGLLLENLALRQQLVVLKRHHPRPRLHLFDRLFWLLVRRYWSGWKQVLLVVTPETVVRWHYAGFRWYWRVISKVSKPTGRRQTSKEVRDLIFQMVAENPSWGAPRIHGELLMLGCEVSERTISRWMKRAPRVPDPAKRWLAFLRNHREAIAAMDFFTVPTVTFSVLYWHAALPIMPTPYRSHRLGGARIVFRVGIIRGLPRSSVACHKGGIHADMRLKEKALARTACV
jgi:putative transposase